jgi:pyridoxamine 5'-phosphate oxidase
MISEEANPVDLFNIWFKEASESESNDPNAVSLATSSPDGHPSVRMVLLKDVDDRGFVFYTNLGSHKGQQLSQNPNVAMCFHWKTLRRQVRIEGVAKAVSIEEADAYFDSRPRMSQIGAWASRQSQPLEGRFELEAKIAKYTARFNIGKVKRPEFWSGYRVVPHTIEFWQDEKFRLHDRLVYTRQDQAWTTKRLYP